MGRIKGAAIRARLDFLRSQHGDEAVTKVVDTLEPMDQVVLSGTVLPSIWYPFHVLANLDEAIRRELGDGSQDVFEQAGDHVARQHARTIYKVFFRETDPDRVLKLASCIFANYYSGLGRVSVRSGEEAIGMSAAWLHAGARTVLSSPVLIADDVACESMARWHALLARGAAPADALAEVSDTADDVVPVLSFGAGW